MSHGISAVVRQRILELDAESCNVCFSKTNLHLDHIWPRALGGDDDPANLWVLCAACNLRKGGRHPYEWWVSIESEVENHEVWLAIGPAVMDAGWRAYVLGTYVEPRL